MIFEIPEDIYNLEMLPYFNEILRKQDLALLYRVEDMEVYIFFMVKIANVEPLLNITAKLNLPIEYYILEDTSESDCDSFELEIKIAAENFLYNYPIYKDTSADEFITSIYPDKYNRKVYQDIAISDLKELKKELNELRDKKQYTYKNQLKAIAKVLEKHKVTLFQLHFADEIVNGFEFYCLSKEIDFNDFNTYFNHKAIKNPKEFTKPNIFTKVAAT